MLKASVLELNCTSRWSSGYWLVVWNLHDQTEAGSIHSPVHHIQTCSCVLAGWTITLVDVQLTVNALVPRHTLTGVQTHVIVAGGAVLTGICLTFININFTVHSCRTNQHRLTQKKLVLSEPLLHLWCRCWIHCCIYVALSYIKYSDIWI